MIEYALGILTGLLIAIINLLALLYFKAPLERTLNQLHSSFKEKGKILEPESGELDIWLQNLKDD